MRFENFIINEGRTQPMKEGEALDFIRQNCKQALKMHREGRSLYRGIKDGGGYNFGITDPMKFDRVSAYTTNYYTLLIDKMKSWDKYPKRSKSLVGASSRARAANQTGELYMAFPVDGTDIGVAPTDDLWDCFDPNLSDFGDILRQLFTIHDIELGNTENQLRYGMKEFDEEYDEGYNYGRVSLGFLKRHQYDGNLYETVSNYLDPVKNRFKLKKVGDKLPTNKEVWWSGKTVFILDGNDAIDRLKED